MDNSLKWLEKIIYYTIVFFMIVILAYLFLLSICSTSAIDSSEHTYYLRDNPMMHLSIIGIFLMLAVYIKRKGSFAKVKWNNKANRMIIVILGITGIMLLYFVLFTQLEPTYDQKTVFQAANNILKSDFSYWDKGGYGERYPNNNGIVLILVLLNKVFNCSYVAIQVLNIVLVLITVFCMYKILNIISKKNKRNNLVILAITSLFFPFTLFVTFVYGTLLGLCCSMLALLSQYLFFEKQKKRYILYTAIAMAMAIVSKSNYMILFLAVTGMFIIDILKNKRNAIVNIVAIITMVIMIIGMNKVVTYTVEQISGHEVSKGVPSTAWIAMGLQESERANGWYNRYNKNIFIENNYDADLTNEACKRDIKESLIKFSKDPRYMIRFFRDKIASVWNNPTFQGIMIQQNRSSIIEIPKYFYDFVYNNSFMSQVFIALFNIVQSIILFGALSYFLNGVRGKNIYELIWAVMFLGGFFFHLFWEGKALYVVTYFIFLIPYSVYGYDELIKSLVHYIENKENISMNYKKIMLSSVLLIIILFLMTPLKKLVQVKGDEKEYTLYIEMNSK